ncbi:unnamed protein product, partial [Ectocarpus sp. 12 AP-2014]
AALPLPISPSVALLSLLSLLACAALCSWSTHSDASTSPETSVVATGISSRGRFPPSSAASTFPAFPPSATAALAETPTNPCIKDTPATSVSPCSFAVPSAAGATSS